MGGNNAVQDNYVPAALVIRDYQVPVGRLAKFHNSTLF